MQRLTGHSISEPVEGLSAVVVGCADKGDIAVTIGVGPACRRSEVQRRLIGCLNLDDVASAARRIIQDIFVALDDVQIVIRDVLHVKPPAGVWSRAERVVDHVADGDDAHIAHAVKGLGAHPQKFVGPQQVGPFSLCNLDEIAVETIYTSSGDQTMGDLADKRITPEYP
jgi:hypothetical protein